MSDKSDELSKKIAEAKQQRRAAPENMEQKLSEYDEKTSFGMRVGIELFAGVMVGAIIGYFFDEVFGTMPIFLIIFIILGAFAGFWNVYKVVSK
jgi:ATP synthase protein I